MKLIKLAFKGVIVPLIRKQSLAIIISQLLSLPSHRFTSYNLRHQCLKNNTLEMGGHLFLLCKGEGVHAFIVELLVQPLNRGHCPTHLLLTIRDTNV